MTDGTTGLRRKRNRINAEKLRLNRNAQQHDIRTAGEMICVACER